MTLPVVSQELLDNVIECGIKETNRTDIFWSEELAELVKENNPVLHKLIFNLKKQPDIIEMASHMGMLIMYKILHEQDLVNQLEENDRL
jgi:hypothetical protein